MKIILPQKASSVEIKVGRRILYDQSFIEHCSQFGNRIAIITDDNVKRLHGLSLEKYLRDHRVDARLFSFPSGEHYKNRSVKEELENQMLMQGYGRDSCVIAIGGGVVTDLAGFLAATYCRGLPLILIPTTLLAMVDASIGGKTGVNTAQGKNMVGCIHQPRLILIDLETLKTLPKTELKQGFAEMIKHALIADEKQFEFLEQCSEKLFSLDLNVLSKAIVDSFNIKLSIVKQDEKDHGTRQLVNFGHTIGHALEALNEYSISHGEAISHGCIVESDISQQLGHLDTNAFQKIQKIFKQYGLSYQTAKPFSIDALIDALSMDKKCIRQNPRFVLLEGIGKPLRKNGQYSYHVDAAILNAVLLRNF